MFKRLLDNVRKLFSKHSEVKGYEQAVKKQLVVEEYRILHTRIKNASNLSQLLQIRNDIRQFQRDTIEDKNYILSKPYIQNLYKMWKRQYIIWKKQ